MFCLSVIVRFVIFCFLLRVCTCLRWTAEWKLRTPYNSYKNEIAQRYTSILGKLSNYIIDYLLFYYVFTLKV